jgi:hypothetical protein
MREKQVKQRWMTWRIIALLALLISITLNSVPSASADETPDPQDPQPLAGQLVYALTTSNQLLTFDSTNPNQIKSRLNITGLAAGENLVGIDFRPATGRLYAVSSASQLYIIELNNGAAVKIGIPFTPLINGTEFGIDFNPTVDRIRFTSDARQNLRLNPDTGAVVAPPDQQLTFNGSDVNSSAIPQVVASAYTNNFPGATTTVLYNLDANLNVLVTQIPPNNGTLNTVGALGVDFSAVAGFDIASLNSNNQVALAALQTGGSTASRLYNINLTNGQATDLGSIGTNETIRDISLFIYDGSVPGTAYALTATNQLISFDPTNPSQIKSRVNVTGLSIGENLLGIDFRPVNKRLYGVGSTSQIFVIDVNSGFATKIGAVLTPLLNGTDFGFDFNPQADRLRITSNATQNLRINPDTGAVVMSDLALVYNTGDVNQASTPNVVASAYTNNFAGTPATTLYNIDSALDNLSTQIPPNDGKLNTRGALGVNIDAISGFDIASSLSTVQTGLAVLQPNATITSRLYSINLATGQATDLGLVGTAESLIGLSIGIIEVGSVFHTLAPTRLYDSRPSGTNTPNPPLGVGEGALAAGNTRTIQATGNAGIPAGATAILANITVVNAVGGGNLSAFPANQDSSATASVNWYQSPTGLGPRTVSNFATIALSPSGAFKVRTDGNSADIIIDVTGYLDRNIVSGGVFKTISGNARLYDSRPSGTNTPNPPLGVGEGALTRGASNNSNVRTLQVTGNLGVPTTAIAVVVNLTAVNTSDSGFFNLYPSGGTIPTTSTLNWQTTGVAGTNIPGVVPNLAIVPLGTGANAGKISISAGGNASTAGANFIVDVLGYIDNVTGATGGFFNPLATPSRLYDSRASQPNFPGSNIKGVLTAGTNRTILARGVLNSPATAVAVRITTVDVAGGGNLAMFPGSVFPGISNVNTTAANQQIGNFAIVALASDGTFTVRLPGGANMGFVLDIVGFIN